MFRDNKMYTTIPEEHDEYASHEDYLISCYENSEFHDEDIIIVDDILDVEESYLDFLISNEPMED